MTWGEDEWFEALKADDDLFVRILEGIAGATHRRLSGPLSPQQCRVLELAAQGLSEVEIAQCMCLGVETVKSHKGRARTRLGARNMIHAVHLAYTMGLIA